MSKSDAWIGYKGKDFKELTKKNTDFLCKFNWNFLAFR